MTKQPKDEKRIEQVPVEMLVPFARNSRTHSDAQVAQIAASIREFSFCNPVLIDASGGIIAGHGRVLAARKLGMTAVPCLRLSHLSETQKRAYVIADNKLTLNAGWDDEALKCELDALVDDGFDYTLTGFDTIPEKGKNDANAEWEGMPEFVQNDCGAFHSVKVNFRSDEDIARFSSVIGQLITKQTKSVWHPRKEREDLKASEFADES